MAGEGLRQGGSLGAGLLLLFVTLCVYAPTLWNGFIWDDNWNVTSNATLRTADGLLRIWLDPFANQQYYPLTHTSLWIQYQLSGESPFMYHLGNLALHAGTVLLLWKILTGLALPGAWLAAAIFSIHPLQVESVAWITERKNMLSGLLLALSVLFLCRHLGLFDGGGSGPIDRRAGFLAIAFFVLALAAKSAVATAPLAMLAVLWWKRDRLRRQDAIRLLPFFAAGIVAGLFTAWIERHHVGAVGEVWSSSLAERFIIAGRVLWFYVGKFFVPLGQVFIYPRWEIDPAQPGAWLLTLSAFAVPLALWALRGRIGKGPAAAALAYGALIAPASGFFDVYFFRYSFVQDHFQYFACAALAAFTAAVLARAVPRRPFFSIASGLLVAGLGLVSFQRGAIYRDSDTLWRDTLARNPRAVMAAVNLGKLRLEEGKLDEAAALYSQALSTDAKSIEALLGKAQVFMVRGEDDAALALCRQALEIRPDHPVARSSLALLLARRGESREALSQYDAAIARAPDFVDPQLNRGILLMRMGRHAEGLDTLRRAAQLDPRRVDVQRALARALLQLGNSVEALETLEQASRRNPDDPGARLELGLALEVLGRSQEADASLREAARLGADPATALDDEGNRLLASGRLVPALNLFTAATRWGRDFAEAHYHRGLILEQLERPAEAIDAYRAALESRPDLKEAHNNLAIALFTVGDYEGAWKEVSALRQLGGSPHPGFLEALEAKTGKRSAATPPPR